MSLKIVVVSLLLSISTSCKKTDLDCSNLKTGSFEQNIEEEHVIVYSTRTPDGFQKDSSKFGVSRYKITWKTDCNYESELLETTSEFSKKHIGRKYLVDIIERVSATQYLYSCRVDGIDFVDIDTIVKTK
jgi:hypothetical protein